MNHTTNYHLPQWVETDRIMMGDFNQMCSDIDEGIAEAKEAADAAQQEAEEKGFVVGSYTGNGAAQYDSGQLIELGFRPRFVIITQGWVGSSSPSDTFLAIAQLRNETQSRVFEFADTGFIAKNYSGGAIALNRSGETYDYIAFK